MHDTVYFCFHLTDHSPHGGSDNPRWPVARLWRKASCLIRLTRATSSFSFFVWVLGNRETRRYEANGAQEFFNADGERIVHADHRGLQPGHGQGRAAFHIYLRLLSGNFKELLHTLSHWWTPSSNLAFVPLSDGVLRADYVARAHSFGAAQEG